MFFLRDWDLFRILGGGGKESNQNWIESGEERRDEDDDDDDEIRSLELNIILERERLAGYKRGFGNDQKIT